MKMMLAIEKSQKLQVGFTRNMFEEILYSSGVLKYTVKAVLVVTSVKHSPALIGHYFVIPYDHFNSNMMHVKQPPAIEGQYFIT